MASAVSLQVLLGLSIIIVHGISYCNFVEDPAQWAQQIKRLAPENSSVSGFNTGSGLGKTHAVQDVSRRSVELAEALWVENASSTVCLSLSVSIRKRT